jgi:hypothetical protein
MNKNPDDFTPIDISSEEWRIYTYPNGSEAHIENPVCLYVIKDDRGGVTHRVVDKDGVSHRPERGWVKISWKPKPGAPAFVA